MNSKKKVAIIDDEPLLCEILKDYLSPSYQVDTFSDPCAFCVDPDINNYDLYLCDVKMPKTNGVDVLNTISTLNFDKHFVFMSGIIDLEDDVLGLVDNDRVYLINKPFDSLEQVDHLIQSLLLR